MAQFDTNLKFGPKLTFWCPMVSVIAWHKVARDTNLRHHPYVIMAYFKSRAPKWPPSLLCQNIPGALGLPSITLWRDPL